MNPLETEAKLSNRVVERLARIRLLLMDVDGVLTDGTLFYVPGESGQMVEAKAFNTQDGLGFYLCHQAGLKTGLISGRESPAVVERARNLQISYVYQGHLAKENSYQEILADAALADDQVAFIGDDFTDAPLVRRAGLGVAVANARPELKAIADLVTAARGGDGAVREVMELILKAQNRWQSVLDLYQLS